jgi:curved DNA-binding protein CbpA
MSTEFSDYYAILDIAKNSTAEQIKSAFKKLAFFWHPDRNPAPEATRKMQDINEAKFILLDTEARQKFDFEYERYHKQQSENKAYRQYQEQREKQQRAEQREEEQQAERQRQGEQWQTEQEKEQFYQAARERQQRERQQERQQERQPPPHYNKPYYVQDDILSRWIENARRQAELAIKDLKGMSRAGYEEGKSELFTQIIAFALMFLVVAIIGFFMRR